MKKVAPIAITIVALGVMLALIAANAIRKHRQLQKFSPVFTSQPQTLPTTSFAPPQIQPMQPKFPSTAQPSTKPQP